MSLHKSLQGLVEKSFHQGSEYFCPTCGGSRRRWSRTLLILLCLTILIAMSVIVEIWAQFRMRGMYFEAEPFHQPQNTRQKITYDTIHVSPDAWKGKRYSGLPTDDTEIAWSQIQKVRGMYLTPAEASVFELPTTGLKITNKDTAEPAIATVLGVQHNIHCIRIVHQALYPSHYYPNQTDTEFAAMLMHAGHCLEAMRLSIQCVPDLTPMSVNWDDQERTDIFINPSAKRQCVNWDSLVAWEQQRSYKKADLWKSNKVLVEDAREDAAYKREHQTSIAE